MRVGLESSDESLKLSKVIGYAIVFLWEHYLAKRGFGSTISLLTMGARKLSNKKGVNMKTLVEHGIGGDGGMIGLYLDEGKIKQIASYPIDKLLAPVNAIVDKAFDGLEKVIPGEWDMAILEPLRASAKAEIAKLIAG